MNSRRRVHVFIAGRVQGVFFRATTRAVAQQLGLTGWVRNLPDGRVEIVAEGPADAVERLLHWTKSGPEGALVTRADVREEPYRGEFSTFRVRG
ncbi:MAG: acylphosphatase [Ardenticatenaceae bacterium]|nr:acylphosphatase [Ardenticatenaceae bacterium]HBY96240.1 acylphosphatase [Chloroflexota bacterium]